MQRARNWALWVRIHHPITLGWLAFRPKWPQDRGISISTFLAGPILCMVLGLPDYAEYDTTVSASADAGYAGPGKQQQESVAFRLHMVFIQAFSLPVNCIVHARL